MLFDRFLKWQRWVLLCFSVCPMYHRWAIVQTCDNCLRNKCSFISWQWLPESFYNGHCIFILEIVPLHHVHFAAFIHLLHINSHILWAYHHCESFAEFSLHHAVHDLYPRVLHYFTSHRVVEPTAHFSKLVFDEEIHFLLVLTQEPLKCFVERSYMCSLLIYLCC